MKLSIWDKTCALPGSPACAGDEKTDVLIIGGGMAGSLCAYRLKQAGVDCLVLEADRIGGGITANTTAKITSQHGFCYHKLLEKYDEDTVRLYFQANQAALKEYRHMAENIPCDFEKKDNFVYSLSDPMILDQELDALSRLGIPGELAENLTLPMPTAGAVRFREQAQFHPLKFLAGIAGDLNIREHTRVLRIQKGKVITDRGIIRAEKIIVATHFPILNRRGLYFMKQYQSRSYVLALDGAQRLEGMYLDGSGLGLSFRNYGNMLLLGGGSHRTGQTSKGWEPLAVFAKAHYPAAGEVARWAAQDCMTLDGIPYIGRYSPRMPWLYVATGFNKWGMTGAMVSSMILRDLILDRENHFAPVFRPDRPLSWPQLTDNILESAANLLKLSRPRCPHLGCALQWNPWEHSWDCPCHGSRFSDSGKLLDGPATRNRKKPNR